MTSSMNINLFSFLLNNTILKYQIEAKIQKKKRQTENYKNQGFLLVA